MNELLQSILFALVVAAGTLVPMVIFIWAELKSRSKN